MKEEVNHPSRYNQGGIEFWDVEKAFFGLDSHIDHLVQSALEYGVRFRRKNGAHDLRKGANLLNVAADLLEGKTSKDEPVEKQHPLQNMTTPNINDVCYAIEKFKIEHGGKCPTVVLVSGKLYNAMTAEINSCSARFKPADGPNDNTTYIMGVRVVVTESTKNHLDMEVL
jgi:hypothetical protein